MDNSKTITLIKTILTKSSENRSLSTVEEIRGNVKHPSKQSGDRPPGYMFTRLFLLKNITYSCM